MSGFRKAKAEQAALKMGLYGPPGSGKTFTALLLAEGLAKVSGKRVAFIDTEHGTDFYCQDVPARSAHPQAFDFDALYTRSLTDVLSNVKSIGPEYGVIVIDSVTHLWEAAKAAYTGKMTKVGTIPLWAWGNIKKPYKDLMNALLSSQLHVLICGRQGIEYENDESTEELKAVGVKMKAEGETPYEPHILLQMETRRGQKKGDPATIIAFAEKDRTGILAGKTYENPTFDTICKPLLGLLGSTQAKIQSEEETAAQDGEALAEAERIRTQNSSETLRTLSAKFDLAQTAAELKEIGKAITPEVKRTMTSADSAQLRDRYLMREGELKG